MNNVDDLLILGKPMETPVPEPEDIKNEDISEESEVDSESESEQESNTDIESEDSEQDQEEEAKPQTKEPEPEQDEYGNEVPKAKTYSEEDVQRMIRERLARVKQPQQQQEQQQQPKKQEGEFQFDENSELGWQEQLESFVERVADKRDQKRAEREMQDRDHREREAFENKFHQGMSRYPDFIDTMQDKNVSDAMVMATSVMNDPAAFLYAAAKKFPEELNRISKLTNPFQQATEMGKLDERMKKAKVTTKATKPIESERSDVIEKVREQPTRDIDRMIQRDAKNKMRRR